MTSPRPTQGDRDCVVASGRAGEIILDDADDLSVTYKILFGDGLLPESDWAAQDAVRTDSSECKFVGHEQHQKRVQDANQLLGEIKATREAKQEQQDEFVAEGARKAAEEERRKTQKAFVFHSDPLALSFVHVPFNGESGEDRTWRLPDGLYIGAHVDIHVRMFARSRTYVDVHRSVRMEDRPWFPQIAEYNPKFAGVVEDILLEEPASITVSGMNMRLNALSGVPDALTKLKLPAYTLTLVSSSELAGGIHVISLYTIGGELIKLQVSWNDTVSMMGERIRLQRSLLSGMPVRILTQAGNILLASDRVVAGCYISDS